MGNPAYQSLASGRVSPWLGHGSGKPCFIDEDQPLRLGALDRMMPIPAGQSHIRPFLLRREYCLFLKVNPIFFKARQTVRSDEERPSCSRSSQAQRSGCCVASSRNRFRSSSPKTGRRPRFKPLSGAFSKPVSRWHCITFRTKVWLTESRSDTSEVVSPDCLASNTRRRMSFDNAAGMAPLLGFHYHYSCLLFFLQLIFVKFALGRNAEASHRALRVVSRHMGDRPFNSKDLRACRFPVGRRG